MSPSTVPLSETSLQTLRELVQHTGQTETCLLDQALEALRRKVFFDQLDDGYREQRAAPGASAELRSEQALWDCTLMDGLDPNEQWTDDGRCQTPETQRGQG